MRTLDTIVGNIWRSIQDYARISWEEIRKHTVNFRVWTAKYKRFDRTWGSNRVLCTRAEMTLRWHPLPQLTLGRLAPPP